MDDLHTFNVPNNTCAIDHSITIGHLPYSMCDSCLKKKGKPTEYYLGKIKFEKSYKKKGIFLVEKEDENEI